MNKIDFLTTRKTADKVLDLSARFSGVLEEVLGQFLSELEQEGIHLDDLNTQELSRLALASILTAHAARYYNSLTAFYVKPGHPQMLAPDEVRELAVSQLMVYLQKDLKSSELLAKKTLEGFLSSSLIKKIREKKRQKTL